MTSDTELNDHEILCQKNIEERNKFVSFCKFNVFSCQCFHNIPNIKHVCTLFQMESFFTDIKNNTQKIQELEEKRKQLKKRVVIKKPKISYSERRISQRLMLIEAEKEEEKGR